jgi:hypothetical protein
MGFLTLAPEGRRMRARELGETTTLELAVAVLYRDLTRVGRESES